MKCIIMFAALIALLSCGSDSDIISPNPSADTSQLAEINEVPVVENPLGLPPEVIDVIAELPNENPPQVHVVVPPEDIEVIVEPPNENPLQIRVVVPPEVLEEVVEPPNENLPIPVVIRVIVPPEAMPEPPDDDPPMDP